MRYNATSLRGWTSRGSRRAPPLTYHDVRDQISDGDILMFVGNGPISRFIRWGSDGSYSHCGIASWDDGQLMVYQAVFNGLQYVAASDCVRKYNGRVDWWKLRPEVAATVDRSGIIEQARRHLGKPFATLGMIHLMWLIARGRYRSNVVERADRPPPPAMFCSWYVSRCYRVGGGVDLVADATDRCTSPAMLEHSELLALEGTLHE